MTRASQRALRIGLTGGIGSGKSTVGAMLAEGGCALIDADAVARSVTAAGGAAMPAICAAFGANFADTSGALDRGRMRELVFADPTARARLEAIVHPLVGRETAAQAAAAVAAGHRCVVFDVPLLVESGRWRQQVDRVLVIDCSAETQIQRVMARSGLARDAVQSIMAAQAARAARLAAADDVICNDGLDLTGLQHEVTALLALWGCGPEPQRGTATL